MTQIFISYAREHEAFARRLYSEIETWGHVPWLDVINIHPGENFDTAIHVGMEAAEVILGVMTPESLQSENVLDEWAYARENNKRLILLLLCEVSKSQIPPQYIRKQRINLVEDEIEGLAKLKQELMGSQTVKKSKEKVHNQREAIPVYIEQAIAALDQFDPQKHEMAIAALAQSKHPAAQEALTAALNHSSQNIRVKVAITLAKITSENDVRVVPGLIEGVAYGDWVGSDIEETSKYFLVRRNRVIIPTLTKYLVDKNDQLRGAVIEIFTLLAEPADAPVLLKALDREESSELIDQLERTVERMGKTALPALIDALPIVTQRHVKIFVIRTLSKIQDKTATPAIIGKLSDDDRFVRGAAIKALAKLEDLNAVAPLIELLSDEEIVEQLDDDWPSNLPRILRVCDMAAGVLEHKFATPEALEAVQRWKQNFTGNSISVEKLWPDRSKKAKPRS